MIALAVVFPFCSPCLIVVSELKGSHCSSMLWCCFAFVKRCSWA
ncbi:hypothetical protein M758_10G071700 [Ceratodon purpureus]|nr:hypothetical protein M758_10G071700 [Ceratodon purpureus]